MPARSLICAVCGTEFVTEGGPRVCRCPSCQKQHIQKTQEERQAIAAKDAHEKAIENQAWICRKIVVVYDPSPEDAALRPGALLSKTEILEAASIGSFPDGMRFITKDKKKQYVLEDARLREVKDDRCIC